MRKWLVLLLTSILAMGLLACGNEQASENQEDAPKEDTSNEEAASEETAPTGIQTVLDKEVEIEFWHAMSGGHEEALTKITDDFNAQSEFVKVKLVNQGGYGDLSQKVMASAKAKTLPVMSQAYEDWITEYLQNNLVTDLTPYINDPQYGWSTDELNDVVEIFREANMWDGKYYGMPFNKSTRILFYNKGLLEEKGVQVPTNWEELRTAAEALTFEKDGKKVVGMGFENSIGLEINMFIEQAGGELMDENTKEVKLNSPEANEAVSFIKGMIDEGVARLAGEDGYMSNPFGRGDVAMYIGSSAGIPYVASAAEGNIEWSASVLPSGEKAATPFAGTNVTVFNSASDEEKLAAWEYIKFLINTENTAYWAEKSGYLPIRYSALESDAWKAYTEANPVYGVGEQQFDAGFYDPRVVGAYGMKNAIAKEIDNILLGQKTVEQGLADAQAAAEAELK
ncbi:ABC transporter substrate-binding protein [Bacillus sp. HMF5848]|uniref:ABC transporter substrate-binding protein n=1 Tax=Bacillus sp. HMF5848 TaxID=2495421 RepID=UPI000F7A413E|nr:ABC transporter substrate-binding protein [Bacillus sp. HMF5848]RSK27760.1 ABC transporter substrate-binding protein [Bacillus sp. HMF5848]